MKNAKSLFGNSEGSGKVIRSRYPGPNHHQMLISTSDWYRPSHNYDNFKVSVKTAHCFFSNPVHRAPITHSLLGGGKIFSLLLLRMPKCASIFGMPFTVTLFGGVHA